jgi:alkanesulfonate monooxygenase SsuD/methylene tetrahydromethanopterin reductase-like flavin-dependent oxidoreductase (luciferase family)
MKLGLFNLMSYRSNPGGVSGVIADTRAMVRLAEEIGFDIAWFAEHHFSNYSISVSPLMLAAHIAGQTRRIRVGAAVVVLPIYHPMRVAQEIALLDQMSDGRAVLGLGSGYQPYEFDRYNVDLTAKTEIFLEYWDVLESALADGRVAYRGKHISVPETVFLLRPKGNLLSEIYLTAKDPKVLARLAHLGPIPFTTAGWRGTAALYKLAEDFAASWRSAGLAHRPMPIAVQQYIHVTDDKEQALQAAECARFVGRIAGHLRSTQPRLNGAFVDAPALPDEPPLSAIRDNLLIGDAHLVAERMVAEIRHLMPVHYSIFFQFGDMPLERAYRSMERFGREVLPLVERELGPLETIGQSATMAAD